MSNHQTTATTFSVTAQRHGARILDLRERELWMRYFDLGNEVEAADDGALHYAHGERADAMVRALYRQYDAARAALAEYRLSL